MHSKCHKNTIKMEKKNTNSEKKKKSIKRKMFLFVFCLFIVIKNNWHWNKWTKNKKNIFFILYIWKSRYQYVALFCCTNQKCACGNFFFKSNLLYSILSFASPLKLKCCTLQHEKIVGCDFFHKTHIHINTFNCKTHEFLKKKDIRNVQSKTVLIKHKPYNITGLDNQGTIYRTKYVHSNKKRAHT